MTIVKTIFPRKFYIQFKAPLHHELIDYVHKNHAVDNDHFKWGKWAIVDKSPIKWSESMQLLTPSIEQFKEALKKDFHYKPFNPWINTYQKGCFQEIHDHGGHDFSCVFFANQKSDFGSFYFFDRDSNALPSGWNKILETPTRWHPNVTAGDIIFFPSDMLHGVTPHKSDEIRKTLACNFNFVSKEEFDQRGNDTYII